MLDIKEPSVTLDDIINAKYNSSFMGDRCEITIDGMSYVKIRKNRWQYIPNQDHVLGGTYSDKEIYELACKAKNIKFYDGE